MSDYELQVFALGGLGEIGKNCYVVETVNDIIIIDCGLKFAGKESLISGIIPNFSYLIEKKKKIKGLFFTHAHDDHLSGAQYLLEKIPDIALFGSRFTIALAKQKTKISAKKKWVPFDRDTVITVGEFEAKFFQVTHSIPGSFGVILRYIPRSVRMVFTGDFKFDWSYIGEDFDLAKLALESSNGIDLLLSESTNAEVEGTTPSERTVVKRIETIIENAPSRVIITSFSSNVYRLKKVIEIAKKTGRFIILLGSSLLKAMKAIRSSSLWSLDGSVFLKASKIIKTPPEKLIIFSTGSQGEERSVLSRLANSSYPGWKILKNDTIIWTSSPILDNKVCVEDINNKLFNSGVLIHEHSPKETLHVSGHASQEDLKFLLKLVSPSYFMPCHGEYHMLKKHSILASEVGISKERSFVCHNGQVIAWKEGKFFLTDKIIDTRPTFVLEGKVLPFEEIENELGARKIIGLGGVIIVILFKDKNTDRWQIPSIYTYGFMDMEKKKKMVEWWKLSVRDFLNKKQPLFDDVDVSVTSFFFSSLFSDLPINNKPLIKVINFFSL